MHFKYSMFSGLKRNKGRFRFENKKGKKQPTTTNWHSNDTIPCGSTA